jgi:RecA/RadA recombinase
MIILNNEQSTFEFSLGKSKTDNCPKQLSAPDFKSFVDVILENTSDQKGLSYICAPMIVGPHDQPEKYSGDNSWRLKSHVKPRRFLSLDLDGINPPEVWFWLRQWFRDQNINCCWYTTSRHTAQEPRVRVVLELSRCVSHSEGVALGQAFEAHIEAVNPVKESIKFDKSVYRGEQPFFLPVVNEQTKQNLGNETDTHHAIFDKEPLDVDLFLANIQVKESLLIKPIYNEWQCKTIDEQYAQIDTFKQALRSWASAGAATGFDSVEAQTQETTLLSVGSIWCRCWVFDQASMHALLNELLKTKVTDFGGNGRNKWLSVVTLAARFSPEGPDSQKIKEALFKWSAEHECYKNDYDGSVEEFERLWAEGQSTTHASNTPFKTLLRLRKQNLPLPQLIMTDGTFVDVLAKPFDLSDAFTFSRYNYEGLKQNFEQMFGALEEPNQLQLFEEPHEQEKAAVERFKFWAVPELQARAPIAWRVKNILPKTGLAAMFGPSGSGKTFLVLDLIARISLGLDFYGYKSATCPVVYVCLEGMNGISNRIMAWEQHHAQKLPDSFRVMADQLSLVNQDAQQFALAVASKGLDGGVIVIDTLNQSAPTADENSSKDMGTIIQNAQAIQRLTNSLVILVHHTGKDTSRGLRGHSSLIAALDAAIEVKRSVMSREWSLSKSKDAENMSGMYFSLENVRVGIDPEGAVISSCIVKPNTSVIFKRPPPTGKNQKIIFDALQNYLAAGAPITFDQAVELTKSSLGIVNKRQTAGAKAAITSLIEGGHLAKNDQGCIGIA